MLADFGVSEQVQGLKEAFQKNFPDTFRVRQRIAGTRLYFSPAIKEAINNQGHEVFHDPFKSDIYSLGLILLEI